MHARARQQPHPLQRPRHQHPPDHRRAARLYRSRGAVRDDAAGASGVRHRHAVRRRACHHLPRIRRPHARLLAGMDPPPEHRVRVAGRGDPRRDHAQALELRGDRRDHRGAHHLDPRSARIGPHLGLPLLLAARCLFRRACAQPHRRERARWKTTSPTSSPSRAGRRARCSRSTASCRPIRSTSASSAI